ncbi:MAG: large subunit ribosomal protein, partial [Microbacteriaceae bacterium]|nr:large subunit ribosomal protein [Microbacteriaceae bacterium]
LQIIEHLDLIVINKGEKVHVDVPVHVIGESAPGTVADLDAKSLLLEVEATNIPESLRIDITDAEAGTHILAKDVELPKGATLVSDEDILVVAVSVPAAQDLGEEPEVEEAAAGESAEEAPAEAAE